MMEQPQCGSPEDGAHNRATLDPAEAGSRPQAEAGERLGTSGRGTVPEQAAVDGTQTCSQLSQRLIAQAEQRRTAQQRRRLQRRRFEARHERTLRMAHAQNTHVVQTQLRADLQATVDAQRRLSVSFCLMFVFCLVFVFCFLFLLK